MLEKVIARERPQALLPTMGGQTSLNLAVALSESGVLERYGVELIGAKMDAIQKAEDRDRFKQVMEDIGLAVPRSQCISHPDEGARGSRPAGPAAHHPAVLHARRLGRQRGLQPPRVRGVRGARPEGQPAPAGADRGVGSRLEGIRAGGDARPRRQRGHRVLDRERRRHGGAHRRQHYGGAGADAERTRSTRRCGTPPSASSAPSGSRRGGSNIQFAVNPANGDMQVIEMNPRVSRSSALASKATGFPIAKIAAKLAVGYTLDEIPNDITRVTPASFEPTIDYCVVKGAAFRLRKIPRHGHLADHADEVGGRGHGHRPHLQGIAAEGAALPGNRPRRIRLAARRRQRRRRTGRGRCARSCPCRTPSACGTWPRRCAAA